MGKTAKEHLNADKKPKIVVMEKDFAGIKQGQKMFVATPKLVDEYIKTIPYGSVQSIEQMRFDLAEQHDCVNTCPLSTAIFVRISAQAAIDDMQQGASINDITPFWRLISSKDKVSRKLDIDSEWLDTQRQIEQTD